ncbi:MAG: hypothetical protein JNG85_07910 [Spirochaetaceae bacterium]|nr:hypothetical protein [Spirochaetaceae bacterium]
MALALLLAFASLGLAAALIAYLAGKLMPLSRDGVRRPRRAPARGPAREGAPAGPAPRSCPLCGTALATGERVKSDILPGKGDRLMRIYGCPRCWPAYPGSAPRICPVCRGELPSEAHAVARYFERPGRKHVHVLGCGLCRKT